MTTQHKHDEPNGLAIASLVLGILAVTGTSILTGIPAIITGIMSLKNPVNKGMGIAGIVMGGISVVLALLIFILFMVLILVGVFAASTDGSIEFDTSSPTDPSYEQRI